MKKTKKILSVLLSLLIILQTGIIAIANDPPQQTTVQSKSMYLSELTPIKATVGWGKLTTDSGLESGLFSLKVGGKRTYFYKSVVAHASAELIYDLGQDHGYEMFECYIGVDYTKTAADAKVSIYTSADNATWRAELSPYRMSGTTEAVHPKFSLNGVRYIRFVFDANGANSYDHTGIGDPICYTGEKPVVGETDALVKPLSYYTDLFSDCNTPEEIVEKHELEVLRRALTMKCASGTVDGYQVLHYSFLSGSKEAERRAMLTWLWNDVDALRELMAGGDPDGGNFIKALDVLSELYKAHGEDLQDTSYLEYFDDTALVANRTKEDIPKNKRTRGELYRTVMFALALVSDNGVYPWLYNSARQDPVERYEIYKAEFDRTTTKTYTGAQEYTLRHEIYENLSVEEMRWVMGTRIWNDEISWLNAYIRLHSTGANLRYTSLYSPHRFLRYGKDWDNAAKGYYNEDNYNNIYKDLYNLVAADGAYNVSYSGSKNKIWMVFGGSHICWGISYVGTNFAASFGVPSHYVLQPGHAAFFVYNRNAKGDAIWGIDNNISGWAQTRTSETVGNGNNRMINNWGTFGTSWVDAWPGSYLMLSTHAHNHYDAYERAEVVRTLDDFYTNTNDKEQLFQAVLKEMPYHLDAWYGLVQIAVNSGNAEKMGDLASKLTAAMYEFPLPMHDLLKLLKTAVSKLSGENATVQAARINTLEKNALVKCSKLTSATCDLAQVDVAVYMANYLMNSATVPLASFSFDGANADTIVFGASYQGVRYRLSFDGGETWTDMETTDASHMTKKLSKEQISSITAEKDILIWLEGWVSDKEGNAPSANGAFCIDILNGSSVSGIEANNNEDRFLGTVSGMEYSTDNGNTWANLTNDVKFTGNVTVKVRKKANGVTLVSPVATYTFTDNLSQSRSYVTIDRLSIADVSSEEPGHNDYAKHTIDGLLSTRWHTLWNGADTQKYITLQLKEPAYINGLDYTPAGGNGTVYAGNVYVSADGINWHLAKSFSGWGYNTNVKSLTFEPVYGKYVKFAVTSSAGNFVSAKKIEIFEDKTYSEQNIVGITLASYPAKREYIKGETLNLSGTVIKAVYENGSKAVIPYSLLDADVTVLQNVGENKVSLKYKNLAPVTFSITVLERTQAVDSVEIAQKPNKLTYYEGEEVDITGMVIKGKVGNIDVTLSPVEYFVDYDFTKVGTAQVTVRVGKVSTVFDVTVNKAFDRIEVTALPDKLDYELGESFDESGIVVTGIYPDKTKVVLSAEEYLIEDISTFSHTSGTQVLTVSLADKLSINTEFTVNVYPYFTKNGIHYEITDDDCLAVTQIDAGASFVTVPEKVTFGSKIYTVNEIDANAVINAQGITDVALPGSIEYIRSGAFTQNSSLRRIYLTAHTSFENLTVEKDAFDANTEIILFAADKDLAQDLKEKENTADLGVDDVADMLTGIVVVKPDVTDVARGEKLDTTGLSVSGIIGENTFVPISIDKVTLSKLDTSTAGEKTVTVTLNGTAFKDSFTVHVLSSNLRIVKHPVGEVYKTLDAVTNALEVQATSDSPADTITYQWYYSESGTIDHEADLIENATESTYVPTKGGFYYASACIEGTQLIVYTMSCQIQMGDFVAIVGNRGYDDLALAFAECQNGETIELMKDVVLTAPISFSNQVILEGNGHVIKRGKNVTGNMITITGNGAMLADNVIFDGGADWCGGYSEKLQRCYGCGGMECGGAVLKCCDSAKLTLEAGVIVRNNYNKNGNSAQTTGTINAVGSSVITLNGASIIDNYTILFGSAIYHRDNTQLIINDCYIKGNSGEERSGSPNSTTVICTDNTSTCVVNGGTFCNNAGYNRGGVFWTANGSLTFNGGVFKDNFYDKEATGKGLNVYVSGSAKVTINSIEASEEFYLTSGKTLQIGGELPAGSLHVVTENKTVGASAITFTNPALAENGAQAVVLNGATPGVKDGKIVVACTNHTPSDWIKSTDNACIEYKVCTNSDCNAKIDTRDSHNEVPFEEQAATCTEDGYTAGTRCSICGVITTGKETIPATRHQYKKDEDKSVAAKCETSGKDVYVCCCCPDTYEVEIPKLLHDYQEITVPATCKAEGKETVICKNCGDKTEGILPKLAHDYEAVETVKVSCKQDGITTYTCKNKDCGDTYTIVEPKLSHTLTTLSASNPTCTQTGLTEGQKCTVCNEIVVKQEVIKALEHDYTYTVTKFATCTQSGSETYTCTRKCGASYEKSVDPIGHIEVIDEAVAATCVADGKTEGKHCSACGEVLVAQQPVGHGAHSYVPLEAVDPTCHKTGLTQGSVCERCGDIQTPQQIVPVENYQEESISAVPASCSQIGYTAGTRCAFCKEYIIEPAVVPKTAHTEKILKAKPATCTQTGLTQGVQCSVCQTVIVEQKTTQMLSHTLVKTPAEEATCIKKGLTEGVKCNVCNEVLTEQEAINTVSHSYDGGVITKVPTCTVKGVITYTCSVCKDTKTGEVNTVAHTYLCVETIAPNCQQQGYSIYKCSCGATENRDYTPITAHKDADYNYLCDYCGAELERPDPSANCSHICHKTGFLGFIWKIVRFFNKLFGTNPVCECGVSHY